MTISSGLLPQCRRCCKEPANIISDSKEGIMYKDSYLKIPSYGFFIIPYPTSESRIRKRPCRSPSWLHTHYIICMTYRQGVFGSFYVFCVFLCVKRHCVIDIHPDSCYHKDAAEAGWLLLVVVFDWLPSPYAGSLYYLPLPNIEYLHTRTSGRVFFLPVLC